MTITSNSALLPFGLIITFLCPSQFCIACLLLCKESLDFIEYHLLFTESLIQAYCRKTVSGKMYLLSQQGSPCTPWNQLTVMRHQQSELIASPFSSKKRVTLFLLRVLFSKKNKAKAFCRQYYLCPRRNLLCYISAIIIIQENLQPNQPVHSNRHTLLNTELLCAVLFSHFIQSSFISLQQLRSYVFCSKIQLYFICSVVPFYYLQRA